MNFEEEIEKLQNGKLLKKAFIRGCSEKACDCKDRTILIDSRNHVVECSECGSILDPFKVLKDMCFKENRYISSVNFMVEQKNEIIKWMKKHQEPVILKEFLQNFRRNYKHGLHPTCPHCREMFTINELNNGCWTTVNCRKEPEAQ